MVTLLDGWENMVDVEQLKWSEGDLKIQQQQQQRDKSATTNNHTGWHRCIRWMTGDFWLEVIWMWGLNSSSTVTGGRHHSQLMLPTTTATTTTTTTLFLPDSRARMRRRGAGKQGKEQNRKEWKAKKFENIRAWCGFSFFFFFYHMTSLLCFCVVARFTTRHNFLQHECVFERNAAQSKSRPCNVDVINGKVRETEKKNLAQQHHTLIDQ